MRKRVVVLGLLAAAGVLLVASCASKEVQRSRELRASLEEASRVFNEHDFEKYATFFTDDFQWEPVSQKTRIGRADFIAFVSNIPKSDPSLYHYQALRLVSTTGAFADECAFVYTNPATGKRYRTFHADIHEFEGLKTRNMASFSDGAAAGVALGMIQPTLPAPPLPGTRVWPTPDPMPTRLKPLDAHKEALNRWNGHDLDSIARMLGSDAEVQFSVLYDPVNRSAYVAWLGVMFRAFPDLAASATRTFDFGDGWVASEVKMSGTNTGPYLGHEPTGRTFALRAAYLGRYDASGLMTILHLYFDSMDVLKQLGLTPVKLTMRETKDQVLR